MVTNLFLVSNYLTSKNWAKRIWILLLLFYIIPDTQCDSHYLRYYYTGMSQSGKMKEFQAMSYIDDEQIMSCNVRGARCDPIASWMKDKENNSYWKEKYDLFVNWQETFNANLIILHRWHNYTNCLLTLQLWYGCEIQTDGYITVHYEYGFDGRSFPVFDTNLIYFDPIMMKATRKDEEMKLERGDEESVKSYLAEICPKSLKKYIVYGRAKLEWKVSPKVQIVPVKVTDRVIRLRCLVYGFHPRSVDVKWERNGVHIPSEDMSPILPHSDGTYQIRVSMEMPKTEDDNYVCLVDHSSLEEEIKTMWDAKKNHFERWIASIIIIISIIIFSVLFPAIVIFLLRSNNTQESTRDSDLPLEYASASILEPEPELTHENPLAILGKNDPEPSYLIDEITKKTLRT